MNVKDIVALANAGFSKDEIAAIVAAQNSAPTTAPQQTEPTPTPAPQQTEPVPTPAIKPPVPTPGDQLTRLLDSMTKLTQTIQANGIIQSNQPEQETTEDILAQVIGPTPKGDK